MTIFMYVEILQFIKAIPVNIAHEKQIVANLYCHKQFGIFVVLLSYFFFGR